MILCPYVPRMMHPETRRFAKDHGALFADVSAWDSAYFLLLDKLWRELPASEDLTIIEHDMVPDAAAWPGMQSCHETWCVQPYPISANGSMAGDSLGCVRFGARLRLALPNLFGHISRITTGAVPSTSWRVLDSYVSRELHVRGYQAHPHGMARHMHIYAV